MDPISRWWWQQWWWWWSRKSVTPQKQILQPDKDKKKKKQKIKVLWEALFFSKSDPEKGNKR